MAICEFECTKCKLSVPDQNYRAMQMVGYDNVAELIDCATVVAGGLPQDSSPRCPRCRRFATLSRLDFHVFHSRLGRDLVVRCFPKTGWLGKARHELLTWSAAEGYAPHGAVPDEDAKSLRRDALFRSAGLLCAVAEPELAAQALERVLADSRGDPELLAFVPWLLAHGKTPLAARIAEAHVERHRAEPEGYFWLAESSIVAIMHGTADGDAEAVANEVLDTALRLAPDHVDSLGAKAKLLLMRRQSDQAAAIYQRILRLAPEQAEAYFNLALLELDRDPARALELFASGEALRPEDGDYPIGRVRALVRLARYGDARKALARGMTLVPDHPRIPELRAQLGV